MSNQSLGGFANPIAWLTRAAKPLPKQTLRIERLLVFEHVIGRPRELVRGGALRYCGKDTEILKILKKLNLEDQIDSE